MTFYDELATLADDLMTNTFGVSAQIVRVHGAYDPATDSRSRSESLTPCLAVIGSRTIASDNGIITTQTVATIDVEVVKGDRLRMNGVEHTVDEVEIVAPTGQPIIWKAVMR